MRDLILQLSKSSIYSTNPSEVENFLFGQGFIKVRKIDDGSWIGILPLAYTTSVCMDIEEITPFRYRWCFANPVEALYLFDTATEFYEIPKKRSSLKGHRYRVAPLLVEMKWSTKTGHRVRVFPVSVF
ncbi:TPA: hypothetical protein OUE34_005267 [Klebsiella pneumoniae]|uniref:hypothetical protein n=1 Tax=Klebsiella pneumoniae TaxID=573 RepID=UPI0022AD45CB|nr:hypothetical protein [Klebsiella pneumoniae]